MSGREALVRYVLRPPIAQDKIEHRPDGLVRIFLKRAYADGTVAVDMDPLSLLCRLAAAVLRRAITPSGTQAWLGQRASGDRGSCLERRKL